MRRSTARTASALAAVAALTLAACGAEEAEPEGPEPTPTEETSPEEPDDPGEPGDEEDDDSTGPDDEAGPDPEGTDPVPDAELPGEEVASYFSEAGQVAHVVGVEAGDVLFVRALPDAATEEVGRLAPTGEATLAGRERDVEHGLWAEVELAGGVGWVNTRYLAYLAEPGEDVTEELRALDADGAGEAVDAAREVAEARVASNHPSDSEDLRPDVVVVETPAQDTLIYRVDIIGLPDDSMAGERLELVLEPGDGGFVVAEGTSIPICWRGASDGLCS